MNKYKNFLPEYFGNGYQDARGMSHGMPNRKHLRAYVDEIHGHISNYLRYGFIVNIKFQDKDKFKKLCRDNNVRYSWFRKSWRFTFKKEGTLEYIEPRLLRSKINFIKLIKKTFKVDVKRSPKSIYEKEWEVYCNQRSKWRR